MIYYAGKTFDKKENKQYKTEKNGIKAAKEQHLNLYDEDGKLVYGEQPDAQPDELHEETPDEQPEQDTAEGAGTDEGLQADNSATEEENGQEDGKDEAQGASEAHPSPEDGRTEVKGYIRRIFAGKLRVRNRPSWDSSAVAGVTTFDRKKVVAAYAVDGKRMYETSDGYFITGAEDLVAFEPEE